MSELIVYRYPGDTIPSLAIHRYERTTDKIFTFSQLIEIGGAIKLDAVVPTTIFRKLVSKLPSVLSLAMFILSWPFTVGNAPAISSFPVGRTRAA